MINGLEKGTQSIRIRITITDQAYSKVEMVQIV